MARYLSPEWVETFDAALGALDLPTPSPRPGAGSLAAADGRFSVVQIVTGAPDDVQAGGRRRAPRPHAWPTGQARLEAGPHR